MIAPNRHAKLEKKKKKKKKIIGIRDKKGRGSSLDHGKGRIGEADPKIAWNTTLMHP